MGKLIYIQINRIIELFCENSYRSVKFHACQGYKYLEPQQAT